MTWGARSGRCWWATPPTGQVSYLAGADTRLLRIAVDPLPGAAPAVVVLCPLAAGSAAEQVSAVLTELERAAVALFPRWLPGADRLDGTGWPGSAAARRLAAEVAARSPNFGPFLADLAERAISGTARRSRFPEEVRARGLARVVADAYRRESLALLVEVSGDLSPAGERALVAAAEWLAHKGQFTVWLAGAALRGAGRVPVVPVTLPAYLTQLLADDGAEPAGAATDPQVRSAVLTYPPLSGLPRPDSPAERRLERALAPYEWARGRRWNHTCDWDTLGKAYRLDLFWPDAGLVVEVDGPDHRDRLRYADDRRRDVQLQLLGYAVARFTNEDVLADVPDVVGKIERLLRNRRGRSPHLMEMGRHGTH